MPAVRAHMPISVGTAVPSLTEALERLFYDDLDASVMPDASMRRRPATWREIDSGASSPWWSRA